jgi:hypothetical protein
VHVTPFVYLHSHVHGGLLRDAVSSYTIGKVVPVLN